MATEPRVRQRTVRINGEELRALLKAERGYHTTVTGLIAGGLGVGFAISMNDLRAMLDQLATAGRLSALHGEVNYREFTVPARSYRHVSIALAFAGGLPLQER